MKTIITGKNMNVSAGITERVMKKTNKMERYLHTDAEMQVRLTRDKNDRRTCEITVPFEGVVLRAEASNDENLYVSIDQALAKLEKQIHKHRTKLGKRLREDAFQSEEFEYVEEMDAADEGKRKIVRNKTFPVRPMSVDDAVLKIAIVRAEDGAFTVQILLVETLARPYLVAHCDDGVLRAYECRIEDGKVLLPVQGEAHACSPTACAPA